MLGIIRKIAFMRTRVTLCLGELNGLYILIGTLIVMFQLNRESFAQMVINII